MKRQTRKNPAATTSQQCWSCKPGLRKVKEKKGHKKARLESRALGEIRHSGKNTNISYQPKSTALKTLIFLILAPKGRQRLRNILPQGRNALNPLISAITIHPIIINPLTTSAEKFRPLACQLSPDDYFNLIIVRIKPGLVRIRFSQAITRLLLVTLNRPDLFSFFSSSITH